MDRMDVSGILPLDTIFRFTTGDVIVVGALPALPCLIMLRPMPLLSLRICDSLGGEKALCCRAVLMLWASLAFLKAIFA